MTVSSYVAAVLQDNPVSYWRLGESSGTTAADEIGALDGTVTGQVGWGVAGAIALDADTAATFNGSSSLIDIGSPAALVFDGTSEISIEAWVNPVTLDPSDRGIVTRQAGTPEHGWELGISSSGLKFRRFLDASALEEAIFTGVGDWAGGYHHVVGTYAAGTLKLYVDGLHVVSASSTAPLTSVDAKVILGARESGTSGYYEGLIDEVAIYSKELPAERVAAHYLSATVR
jgi:hypothetical protein